MITQICDVGQNDFKHLERKYRGTKVDNYTCTLNTSINRIEIHRVSFLSKLTDEPYYRL